MVSVGRMLFIWLLVLVVPTQGLAAALTAPCGSHHPAGATAVLLPLQGDRGATPGHGMAGGHAVDTEAAGAAAPCPHHGPTAGAVGGADVAASPADAAAPSPGGDTCSACAACSSVGAPQSMVLAVPAATCPAVAFAAVQAPVSGCAADGLERPPRAVPA